MLPAEHDSNIIQFYIVSNMREMTHTGNFLVIVAKLG